MNKITGNIGITPGPIGSFAIFGGLYSIEYQSLWFVLLALVIITAYAVIRKPLKEVLQTNKKFLILFCLFSLFSTFIPFILSTIFASPIIIFASKILTGISGVLLMFTIYKFYTPEAIEKLNWKIVRG